MADNVDIFDVTAAHAADTEFFVRRGMTKGYEIMSLLVPPAYAAFAISRYGRSQVTVNRLLRATWVGGSVGARLTYSSQGSEAKPVSQALLAEARLNTSGQLTQHQRMLEIEGWLQHTMCVQLYAPAAYAHTLGHRPLRFGQTTIPLSVVFCSLCSPRPSSGKGRARSIVSSYLSYG